MIDNNQQNNAVIVSVFNYAADRVKQSLGVAGEVMKQEAEKALKDRNGYATGKIVKTIKSKVKNIRDGFSLEFGCYAKSPTGYPYASVVEYGRRPGLRPPPSSVIEQWLYFKGRTGHISVMITQSTKGLAYIIAKKIGKEGIPEKPFMRPAFIVGLEQFRAEF